MSGLCNPNYKTASWALFRYEPQTAPAAVFAAVFGITTLLHLLQLVKTRTWYLTAFLIGGICETVGYIARGISTKETPGCWSLGPYIVQNILLLIAPAFMAASIYMILGRIIMLTNGESHAIIKRRWLTKLFVTGDVVSLLMQSSGGGLMAMAGPTNNFMHTGETIIMAGLVVQVVIFGLFMVVSALFHWRMALMPTAKSAQPEIRWNQYLLTLYVTSILILIRSVFRLVEYVQGNAGYLLSNEIFIFIFDAVLMTIVMVWMNWFHPSEIGLLLRGDTPITNGFQLFTRRSSSKVHVRMSSDISTSGYPLEERPGPPNHQEK